MPKKHQELYDLMIETRRVLNGFTRFTDNLHQASALTEGQRLILELIADQVRTVPDLARVRGVSRQHIQIVVNDLVSAGLVELMRNPAHKRSALVALTDRGADLFEEMKNRERNALTLLGKDLSKKDVQRTRDFLQGLDDLLAGRKG